MTACDCVLGAGPAAAACAHQLLKAGRKVVLIDPGRNLPPERKALIEEFRENPDPYEFVARMRALQAKLPGSLRTRRLPFASSHVFDDVDRLLPAETRNATVLRTLASGGLSAMWGATVMPFSARSFRNWPVTLEEMAPFYRSVAEIMDVPHVEDELGKFYPNFGDAAPLALSQQGAQLMANLLNHKQQLAARGMTIGRCRSAVGSLYTNNGVGCVYCGLCMYGCPHRAIFSADYAIEHLVARACFTRRCGWIAEHFEEQDARVSIRLREIMSGKTEIFECEHLFVACGAATTLHLTASSLKWFDETLYLSDTQLVAIPALLNHRTELGPLPQANVLGQVFVELDDPNICDELIHLQIYGFQPFIADVLRARWGIFYPGDALLRPLFDRFMLVMGYLPGQLSGKVALCVKAPAKDHIGLPPATFIGSTNIRTQTAAQHIRVTLKSLRREFGWRPLLSRMEIPEPGFSNHLAGGLPMGKVPGPRESDILGRPAGLRRVHIADGASFPDLPGEHLTYTIMANAARIASQTAEGQSS